MAFTQGHALLIGVGVYKYEVDLTVPITVDDAQAVHDILVDEGRCGYPEPQVVFLKNDQATKDNILAQLSALAQTAGEDDTLFIFFCGHGMLGTDGSYYLAGHDARLDRKAGKLMAYTGVSEGELIRRLKEIRAKRVLMIFNACQSGHLSPSLGSPQPAIRSTSLGEDTSSALLGTGEGRIIITACRENQYSYIGNGNLTIFTQELVKGLSGQDVDNSGGTISVYSLYDHLYRRVSEKAQEEARSTQEPELNVLKGVGPFPVALYKGATTLGDFKYDQPIPELPGVRTVKPADAVRAMNNLISMGDIHAELGSVVNIAGRDINNTTNRKVDTRGGAYVEELTIKDGGEVVFGNKIEKKTGS